MAQAASRNADILVVTSDNPRTEDPNSIIEEIVNGLPDRRQALIIPDRAQAIQYAIAHSRPEDAILIAGKGHEDYQIIGTTKTHFSDQEIARRCLVDRGLKQRV